eukprot:3363380-Alexandrium_andersonii.AAC.1
MSPQDGNGAGAASQLGFVRGAVGRARRGQAGGEVSVDGPRLARRAAASRRAARVAARLRGETARSWE